MPVSYPQAAPALPLFPEITGICVTGTDTDSGKTVLTAALARSAALKGYRVLVIKPVQTGCLEQGGTSLLSPDEQVYREACPEARSLTLVSLAAACSPHLAASLTGPDTVLPDARTLAARIREIMSEEGFSDGRPVATLRPPATFLLVEGAGGPLTPIGPSETFLDLFLNLGLPVVFTVANRLGAINHALMTGRVLEQAGIYVPGFILMETGGSCGGGDKGLEQRIRLDNPQTIARLSGLNCLAHLPHIAGIHSPDASDRARAWDHAAALTAPLLDILPESPACGRARLPDALAFDRDHIWHPYTSALQPTRVRLAETTTASRIRLSGGQEVIDGMSSWWCAIHGYRHPRLVEALHRQASKMPHVMFGGLTHRPAIELADRLLAMAPSGMEHVFFSDSGSVSVEVAIKMAIQFQSACGHPGRHRLLALHGGYHGDTLGAMSVCDPVTGMHSLFNGLLPRQIFAPRPSSRFDAEYDPACGRKFARTLRAHAAEVAAVILEPVVQGAGGMWFYHPEFLKDVRQACDEHGCLLILDEIATGFGRTGKLFACQWAGVRPDILCLGKALTGGVISLAATLATRRVALGISGQGGALMHGPTFMANPLACAAGCASLDLLDEYDWQERVACIERGLQEGLAGCRSLPGVSDVRVLGSIGVLEMERQVKVDKVQDYFIEQHGVWLRPFGRNIYTMPPYTISRLELEKITSAMAGAVLDGQWE